MLVDSYKGLDGWNEIIDWSWDIEVEISFLKGLGVVVGKFILGIFFIIYLYDIVVLVIMICIVMGMYFDEV